MVNLTEAGYQHKDVEKAITKSPNYFNSEQRSSKLNQVISFINSVKAGYQAIIPLSYYHIGSDNFGKEASDQSMLHSMIISYECNIPLMSSSAARTPIPEAKKLMQFFSPPFLKKEIQQDFKSNRPFLLLVSEGELNDQEKWMLSLGKKLYESEHLAVYRVEYESVFKSTASEEYAAFHSIRDLLHKQEVFLTSKPDDVIYFDFDSMDCDTVMHGTGSLRSIAKQYTNIIEREELQLDPGREYVLSYWFYNNEECINGVNCIIAEQEPDVKDEAWNYFFGPIQSMVIGGNWSLVEQKFKVKSKQSKTSIFFKGDDKSNQVFYVDDFMIRPADTDVYQLTKTKAADGDSLLCKNNLWVTK
jgi:hypothetical protein